MAGSPDIVPFDTDTDNKNAVNMNDLNNVDGDIVNKGTVHDMTAEDRNTALQLAMKADPGVPAFSGRMFGLCAMLTVVLMCGGDAGESTPGPRTDSVGFDGTVMGAVNSMDQFKDYFNINVHDQSLIFVSSPSSSTTWLLDSRTVQGHVHRRPGYCVLSFVYYPRYSRTTLVHVRRQYLSHVSDITPRGLV